MANGTNSQSQWRFQRPANRIYRVGANLYFTSIQAAIDQAVADGFTSSANIAVVEVDPGTYNENVALKPGVYLVNQTQFNGGVANDGSGGIVTINGNSTYANSNAASIGANTIFVNGINFTCLNGVALAVSGTAALRLILNQCNVHKQVGGDINPCFSMNNTGSNSVTRFQDSSSVQSCVANVAVDVVNGIVEMRDRTTQIFSPNSTTLLAAVNVDNSSTFTAWNCDNWFTGAATNMIEIKSATSVAQLLHCRFNLTNAGGNGILFTAAGTARVRFTQIQINANVAGYIAKGAAGTFGQGNNVIIGTNQQAQNTLTIGTNVTVVVPTP